jgi:hypothetical protein
MSTKFREADRVAMNACERSWRDGACHSVSLNIAVSAWFCRCPNLDTRWARPRVSRLLDESAHAA